MAQAAHFKGNDMATYDTGNHADPVDYAGQEEAVIRALRAAQAKAANTNSMMPTGRLSNPFDRIAQYMKDRSTDSDLSAAETRAADFGKEKSRYITDLVTQMSEPGVVKVQTANPDPNMVGPMINEDISRSMKPEEVATRNLPLAMKLMQTPGGEELGRPAYAQALALPAARLKAEEDRQAKIDADTRHAEDLKVAREEGHAYRLSEQANAGTIAAANRVPRQDQKMFIDTTDEKGNPVKKLVNVSQLPDGTTFNSVPKTNSNAPLSPEKDAALQKSIAEGKIDPMAINSRNRNVLADAAFANPGFDFKTSHGQALIRGNATFQQRVAGAEALPEIIDGVRNAGAKLDFSPYTPISNAEFQYKLHTGDPELTYYMTKRNDAVQSIAQVMRGTGMSDKSIQLEINAAREAMSPAQFDTWYAGQVETLQPRLQQMAKIAGMPTKEYTKGLLNKSYDATPSPAVVGPSATPTVSLPKTLAIPGSNSSDTPPAGVPPATWAKMSPEDRRLFQ